jgi:hypothetical protein
VRQSPLIGRLVPYGVAIVVAALLFARLPAESRETIWAEDGSRFLGDALAGRGLTAVAEPFGGYLHVVPRMLAAVAVWAAPIGDLALVVNVLACATVGVIAAVVYVCSAGVIPHPAPRLWLASAAALLPLVGVEVAASLANLHWFFLWGMFWALLWRPRTGRGAAGAAVFLLAGTLTEAQGALLLPVAAVVAWWRRRDRRALIPVVAYAAGVLAQAAVAVGAPRSSERQVAPLADLMTALAAQVLLPLWTTDVDAIRGGLASHGWLVAAAAAPLTALAAIALWRGDRRLRGVTVAVMVLAVVALSAAHSMSGQVPVASGAVGAGQVLSRYGVVPSLFLVSVVALGTQAALRRQDRLLTSVGLLTAAAIVVSGVVNFHGPNRRNPATAWPAQLPMARATCQLLGPTSVWVPISPGGRWGVRVPCVVLDARVGEARGQPTGS